MFRKKNKYDDREIRALTQRPNIVRTTVRALGAGISFFTLYSVGFSLYTQHQQRTFIQEGNGVVHRAEALLDSLQQERSYLLPAGGGSALDQVVAELQALRSDLLGHCSAPRVLERGAYTAAVRGCALQVTIPRGGSLSEASQLYFGDYAKWREDREQNHHIRNPDHVRAGERYTFSLR